MSRGRRPDVLVGRVAGAELTTEQHALVDALGVPERTAPADWMVGMNTARMSAADVTPGSTRDRVCEFCRCSIWTAPSAQRVIVAKTRFACFECMPRIGAS